MKHLAILLFTLLLTACYSTGQPIDTAKANQFVKGQTTESEVLTALGTPITVTNNSEGERMLAYSHTDTDIDASTYIPVVGLFTGGATSKVQYLIVTLDKTGVVKDWQTSETVVSTN
jgi:outer membrane protein assembly factor BamE (lipoprotein component of BamABCDE complex)